MPRIRMLAAALAGLGLAGCQRVIDREPALPAELEALAEAHPGAEPRWAVLEIDGEDGPLRVRVPLLLFTGGGGTAARVDTAALAALERRLLGRIGAVARAEAAALLERSGLRAAAPEVVGHVAFSPGDTLLDDEGARNARALAARLSGREGAIEVRGYAAGDHAAAAAVARARAVWGAMLDSSPGLTRRAVLLSGSRWLADGSDGAGDRVEIRLLPYPPP